MKKVLSILLIVAVIAGILPLSVVADSSTSPVIGFSGIDADMLDPSKISEFGSIPIGSDRTVLEIPILWENFDFGTDPADPSHVNINVMNSVELVFDPPNLADRFTIVSAKPMTQDSSKRPYFILTGYDIGAVKGTVRLRYKPYPTATSNLWQDSKEYPINGVFIDPTINNHIVAISGQNIATESNYVEHNGVRIWEWNSSLKGTDLEAHQAALTKALSNMSIQPGDELVFSLHTDHFIWDPNLARMRSSVRKSTLDNDLVNAIKTHIAGIETVKSVAFENRDGNSAAIVIHFRDDYPVTKEREFVFRIALGIRGVRNNPSSIVISGEYGNPVYEADEDNDYVFIGDGMVVDALRYVRNIELDLDNGVSLFANLGEGKRYWGRADVLPTADDRDIMNFFPTIRKAITLKTTSNVPGVTKHVELHEDQNYYVYDSDGKYLGMSFEKLPFRNKYYLSTAQLSFDVEVEDIEFMPEEIGVSENPSTGGGNSAQMIYNVIGLAALAGGAFIISRKDKKSKSDNE